MLETTLGDACARIDYGFTASSTLDDVGPRFLRITDIEQSHVAWSTVPFCMATAAEEAKYALADGDIVVARTGASTGRSQWIQLDEPAVFASYLVRFRTKSEFDSRFIAFLLQTSEWLGFVDRQAHGKSAQPNMSAASMAAFRFRYPPLAEQQAIAEVLGALDDKIAANTTLAATADLCASTVLLQSLSTHRVRLDSLARITMGSSPKGETLNEIGEGVPFYQGVRDFGFRSPTRRVFTTSPVRSADAGDILLSVRAPVGDVNLAAEPICIGRGVAAVRSTVGTQATLFHQLRVEREAWEPFEAEGTVFGSINRDQLHGIQLRPVVDHLADAVERQLAAIEASIESTLAENRILAATRDALLPHLMSGKLLVRDAVRLVEREV